MTTKTTNGDVSVTNLNARNIMLAPNLRVQLVMTEELVPITKDEWENLPPHLYADIDDWD